MTGGLIQLVAYGTQDIFLTKDPQITFFKTVYRRHTNFSTEMISQHFPSTPNFGDKISATISRSGDLIRKMYIVFTLPPIPILKENGVPSEKLKFAWVKKLGYALIKSVEIEIGGQSIDKHYGEWLHIWNELTGPKNRGFDIMIGNTDEVNKFNCCKSTFTLYVPLQFYFCRYSGLALPIVNLQYHEIKINLELSHIKSTYIRAPKNYIKICNDLVQFTDYEYIVQDVDGTTAFGQFIYFDKLTNLLYYNRISSNTFQSVSGTFAPSTIKTELRKTENQKYNIKGSTSGFIVQPYVNEKEKVYALPKIPNFNIIECYLLVEYIYLDQEERKKFTTNNLEYLIEQIQYSGEKIIDSANMKVLLGFSHPCKEFIWITQQSYLTNSINNDHFNYTDSYVYDEGYVGKNLIEKQTISLNGHERVSKREQEYFDIIQPFQNHSYTPAPGINTYSFCLYPELYQPSGPANMSKLDNVNINLIINKSITLKDKAKFRVYAITYNILRISNGIGGLVFIT